MGWRENTIWNKPDKKQDSLKVNIKTQSGEICIKIVSIDVLVFNTDLAKALLKLLVWLNKILKDLNLNIGQQLHAMKNIFLAGEALQFFEQKHW